MKKVFLFDVDGTLVESGYKINDNMITALNKLKNIGEIGIVGGGCYDKIKWQLEGCHDIIKYFFTESGSIYYRGNDLIAMNNVRQDPTYVNIDKLKKLALKFLSDVEYTLSGHFIDQRTAMVYISLIGLSATKDERNCFMELDKINKYRERLLSLLISNNIDANIEICYGGSVGIAIYPKKWNKSQVLKYFDESYEIHYFGDKYEIYGNDYLLLNDPRVIGHKIDSIGDTVTVISHLVCYN